MPADVTLDALLAALKAGAEALALTVGGVAVAWEVRKECAIVDGVDVEPLGLIAGKLPESAEPFSGGSPPRVLADYGVQINVYAPGQRDGVTARADLTNARRQVRGLFDRPWALGVPGLLFARREGPGYDAAAFARNVDNVPMGVRLRVVEDAN